MALFKDNTGERKLFQEATPCTEASCMVQHTRKQTSCQIAWNGSTFSVIMDNWIGDEAAIYCNVFGGCPVQWNTHRFLVQFIVFQSEDAATIYTSAYWRGLSSLHRYPTRIFLKHEHKVHSFWNLLSPRSQSVRPPPLSALGCGSTLFSPPWDTVCPGTGLEPLKWACWMNRPDPKSDIHLVRIIWSLTVHLHTFTMKTCAMKNSPKSTSKDCRQGYGNCASVERLRSNLFCNLRTHDCWASRQHGPPNHSSSTKFSRITASTNSFEISVAFVIYRCCLWSSSSYLHDNADLDGGSIPTFN